ncbi:MAG: flagellar basal body P-ring protein FlgI [Alphaproteobacteria bacterium]|nr:flagellar basal body P-ring protein FlgI [Alphaproteobacteria bacterium]MDE2336156.1 flagellar basal body P-ring protein FlgI [Alphaproteobacteria bacterium]
MKTYIYKTLSRLFLTVTLAVLTAGVTLQAAPAHADVKARIKDIVQFEGVRDNLLIGYGLAVGLNGTGDTLNNAPFTQQSLIGMLERLGVNIRDLSMTTKNVAAVMVTATLPPFTNEGARIDVTVSTLGDAKSLEGGTLLVTPLLGADGKVYAVAQGSVSVGGFTASGSSGSSVTQNIPTTGRISGGAIVEREVPFRLNSMKTTRLSLRNPDFTTAHRIADTINAFEKADIAHAQNPASVELSLPPGYKGGMVSLLTDIEPLEVQPDQIARVVIDERSGVIVMGAHVHISTVALAQGNLTIRISETPQVSQPTPFSQGGTTTTVPRTSISVDSGSDKKVALLKGGVSLQDLVTSLNALGVGPRDIITILQSIKAAGALQAQLKVM